MSLRGFGSLEAQQPSAKYCRGIAWIDARSNLEELVERPVGKNVVFPAIATLKTF